MGALTTTKPSSARTLKLPPLLPSLPSPLHHHLLQMTGGGGGSGGIREESAALAEEDEEDEEDEAAASFLCYEHGIFMLQFLFAVIIDDVPQSTSIQVRCLIGWLVR